MSKVYFSAVVIIPPEDKWEPIQEIRKKYDRQINRWMPHITLLYPFRPETDYDMLSKSFSEICKSIDPFEILLKEFHYFNHGHQKYTLWLKPDPVVLIKDLQAKMLEIVPDCNDVNKYKKGFNPHLSVGQITGKDNLLKLIKNLEDKWIEIKFFLYQIFFISREKSKTSQFEIRKRIQLQRD
ncbi:MAG: 2'-5' RNA ligase family protein [Candidatus Thorarchaeota archaeon]